MNLRSYNDIKRLINGQKKFLFCFILIAKVYLFIFGILLHYWNQNIIDEVVIYLNENKVNL